MQVLVTGGTGYIGSHTIVELINHGYDVVAVDDFSNSKPIVLDNLEKITGKKINFYELNVCDKEKLSDLSNEDWIELGIIEKELERIMKKIFNATMFNFACLMNNVYRDNEKSHVHFHFIPRYNGERIILNKKYTDVHF